MSLDGVAYDIGGLVGQTNFAFVNDSLLSQLRSPEEHVFVFQTYRTGVPAPRYQWTPGTRFSDPSAAWPPKGITLEIDFVPTTSAPAAHKSVVVTVVYTMYDNLPMYEKHIVISNAEGALDVVVESMSIDVLYATREALGYFPSIIDGLISASTVTGRIHMTSEMTRGGTLSRICSSWFWFDACYFFSRPVWGCILYLCALHMAHGWS